MATQQEQYASCAPLQYANWVATDTGYNASGDPINATDADATHNVAGHRATTGACTGFSQCASYDATYGFLGGTKTNVLNQAATAHYTTTAAGGYGLWPMSATDANGQTTSTTYDALGRPLTVTSPGETGLWTTQLAYTPWCPPTGAAQACNEADATQRLDATTTVLSRIFYDGAGRAVESRTLGPNGQDVVQYALYDQLGNRYFVSQPYFVTAYTGNAGAGAYSTPNLSIAGTSTTYDSLGRVLTSTDANSATTTTSYASVCAPAGTGDTGCFAATTVVDANHHQSLSFTDAMGHADYAQTFTGSGPYTVYRTTKAQYDVLGDTVSTTYADGSHQATATYDALKRQTAFTDPDLGSYTLSYDFNGNLLSSADPRGASGTVYLGYDGLNRNVWKSTNSTGSNPLATATYDSTASGNQGIGRLTSETFASGPSQSVTGGYAYTYDAQGRQTASTMTLGSTSYPFTTGYNDAGQATSLTYPDGDVVTTNYGAQDWLSGVTEAKGSTTNTLLNTLSYTGANGASQLPTSATVDNGVYNWSLSYDPNLRLTEAKVTQVSNSVTLFDQTRGFDAVGNVTTTSTTLPAGTDRQAFCYDEQNRLVWSGSQGTPSCGAALTPGTLTTGNARYTQAYAYDTLNRLTTGPKGSGYTYGDNTHLDALTAAPSYSASYDAAGDMTARSGQVLGYNALRQLITWQNQAASPTQTASYAYNGSGERVQQSVTSGGGTTTTSYIGAYEDIATTGGTTTTTKYYQLGKVGTAEAVNGTLYYQIADDLGSVAATLTASGGVQATELYDPFGAVRYSNGTMPTSYGFTKMRQDPSGLNYDHARYYDANVGQFITADSVQGPNRYAYVGGNPETKTDPSGNDPLIGAAIGLTVGVLADGISQTAHTGTISDYGALAAAGALGAGEGAFLGGFGTDLLTNPFGTNVFLGYNEALISGIAKNESGGQILGDVAVGTWLGAGSGIASSLLADTPLPPEASGAISGAITNGLSDAGSQLASGKPFNWKEVGFSAGFGAFEGAFFEGVNNEKSGAPYIVSKEAGRTLAAVGTIAFDSLTAAAFSAQSQVKQAVPRASSAVSNTVSQASSAASNAVSQAGSVLSNVASNLGL